MEKIKLYETFSVGDVSLTEQDAICESETDFSSVIDGINIIGIVEGQFFQPDGMSRNNRWYSRKLWENVLACPDVRTRLASRTMYGEIGHSDGPVTDMTLRDGSVSHIVADLWIDEKGRGMGRAYILDTPKGRLLKTYLGAKSKLKVSTRGEGVYLDGQYHDGYPIIDPDTYELQTVDFVLNPGFLETNAKLTVKKEDFTNKSKMQSPQANKQVNETTNTKEGEKRMDFNTNDYIQELRDKIAKLEAKNESLSEELKTKNTELLEAKFTESTEMKSIKEAYAPFKKMGVSAKSLNETLKKVQTSLQKSNEKNAKLTEELSFYQDKCGSKEQVEEALKMSEKALSTISEYQKLGTVEELKDLMAKSEALVPKLKQLSALTEYRKLGSVKDLKSLVERCEKSLPKLKEMKILEDYKALGTIEEIKTLSKKCEAVLPKLKQLSSLKEYRALGSVSELKTLIEKCEKALPRLKELSILEDYKKLGTVEEIRTLSKNCENMLPKLKQLKDAEKLAENVQKLMPKLKEMKSIEETAKSAKHVIEQYVSTVGSIKQAKSLVESRKETIKTVNLKEAFQLSKKFGCTIENAAKLIKKYGANEATKLIEAKVKSVKKTNSVKLTESKKLVEEAGELETVNKTEVKKADKTAKDFLQSGMIVNGFNPEAFGKKINTENLDKLDGNKIAGEDQAKALLNKLKDINAEVEKAPKVEPTETNPAEAEKAVKELLK